MHSDATVPHQLDHLLRQACDELRRRLDGGQPAPAESILRDFSSLVAVDHQAVRLIESEWRLRRARGEPLEVEAFCARFPQWQAQLRRRLRGGDSSDDEQQGLTTVAEAGAGDDSAPLSTTYTLNDHEIYEVIGQGGMGSVHRAFDRVLKRFVALKVIKTGLLASPEEVRRFYREAQTAAQLQHPHIIAIHGMGLHRGEHCFTMSLAPGGNLATRRAEYAEPRQAVALVMKIAGAVAHAHHHGIVHRDLKPANILFDERDEPLVSDFGLAKMLRGSTELTINGQVLGTPAYMSPEQAAGRTWEIGPHSDAWSLGVILYELLTGRKPFSGESSEEILRNVLHAEYPHPATHVADLDPGLGRIVATCLHKTPAARYANAGLLLADLECWSQGKPAALVRSPQPQRTRRRFALVACGLVLLAATVALGATLPWWQSRQPETSTATQPPAPKPGPVTFPAAVSHGRGTLVHNDDGSVTLEAGAGERAWVVLGNSGGLERYRFSIEVKDLQADSFQVGIFWDFYEFAQGEETTWCFNRWTFAEHNRLGYELGVERTTGWMSFEFMRRATGNPREEMVTRGQFSRPFNVRAGKYRTLMLEVDATGAHASWDGAERSELIVAPAEFGRFWNDVCKAPPALAQRCPPQGSGKFGLYCVEGKAQFRNPNLEPLANGR